MDLSYFITRFGSFNKDIISLRSSFLNNCHISDIKNLISDLQYETQTSKPNFRWGQRYFNSSNQTLSWISSVDGKIKVSFFDRNNHTPISYDKKIYFNDTMIDEHCFSHNKTKRKIGFFYKLSDKEKLEFNNYSNALLNLYMVHKKTYGLAQKAETDVIWFDIDNHNKDMNCDLYQTNPAIDKLKTLMKILDISLKDFLYIEANILTGGIHCALKIPYLIKKDSNFFQKFEKELNEFVSIECNFQSKLLRLPLSFEYLPLKRDINIDNIKQFSDEDFEESFSSMSKNMNYNPVNSNFILKYFAKPKTIDDVKKVKKELTNEEKLINLKKSILNKKIEQDNYWATPQHLFVRNKTSIIKTKELYKINKEHRWETFKVLIPYLKVAGKSLDEVFEILKKQNIDSKDMKDFDSLKKDITTFYNNIKLAPKNFGIYQSYISNESLISEITKKFLDDPDIRTYLTDKFIENYVKVRNYKNQFVSEEKYEILKKQVPYFIKEIIGKMYYDVKNPKEFINQKLNHFKGFQLSYTHLEKIQNQSIIDLKLEESPLNKTSLQYLKKALLLTLDLEEIENNCKGKRNWIKGSCKSFRINSFNDIEEVLRHLYNRCFKDLVINNFIKKQNIYTLYISLIENNDIINLDDVLFIKSHIPIINDS